MVSASRDGDVFSAAAAVGLAPEEILDFSGTAASGPMPEELRQVLQDSMKCLERYPDPLARGLRQKAAERFGVRPDEVSAGNGTTEFVYAIPRALRPRRTVVLAPCCHDFWRASDLAGVEPEGVLASEAHEFIPDMAQVEMHLSGVDLAYIGNPNNPTGVALPGDHIRSLAAKFPRTIIVVDESFAEFTPDSQGISLLHGPRPENIVLLRTPSTLLGLPGLPIGFMIASPDLCAQVERVREPWTLSSLAQCIGKALVLAARDSSALREAAIAERERLRDELSRMAGLRVFRSQANFLLLKITKPGLTSSELCARLLTHKVLIRNAAGFRGLDAKFVRVCVRSPADNDRLLTAMRRAMEEAKK